MPAGDSGSDADGRPDLTGPHPGGVFGRLFGRHARPLHRYLARRIGDVADDLVTETFLVALQTRERYDPARGTARSWLYGIATNLLRRHVRQEVRGLRAATRAAGGTETGTTTAAGSPTGSTRRPEPAGWPARSPTSTPGTATPCC
ncbi:Sigma-70 region 2 [Amycolatopsis arida]|uniref:Sigma-70 region 2 n=1 Tax=Amycolatopsis arida TaxID=587909 RepID=A0A1I5Z3A2_9PSEU|nr:sigma-70-like protein [Amycolatopsis arida]SFQ50920.1 Sigma-70 region 2 [Amycolatopsis arida]